MIPVIHRPQSSQVQQLGKLIHIDVVTLAPALQQLVAPRITDHAFGYPPFQQIIKPGRLGPFFKRHMNRPTQTRDQFLDRLGFRLHYCMPDAFTCTISHTHCYACFMHIQRYILMVLHRALLLDESWLIRQLQLTPLGAPFHNAWSLTDGLSGMLMPTRRGIDLRRYTLTSGNERYRFPVSLANALTTAGEITG